MLLSTSRESFFLEFLIEQSKDSIHRTTILSIVLYRCETLSLMLREEHRSKVFETRVLRKTSEPRGDEVRQE
jgi:hypothetical protein